MNSKRRADLQRKLSMGAVPRPPSDLLDRIKADIPHHLKPEPEQENFTGSMAFTMRVAASILMLITTAFITLRLIEPETKLTRSSAPRQIVVPAVEHFQPSSPRVVSDAPPSPAATDEVQVEITQTAGLRADAYSVDRLADLPARSAIVAEVPPPPAAATAPRERREEQIADSRANDARELKTKEDLDQAAAGAEPEAVRSYTFAPQVAAPSAEASRSRDTAAFAGAAAPPSPSILSEAHASEIAYGPRSEVFGISVDPNVFNAVRNELQEGKRPAASSIDVDALVNYFAGPPARRPRALSLEVEASPAPVEAEGDHAILRFTIDTPRMDIAARSSIPPVARDARVEIEIDPRAVATFRRIGGPSELDSEESTLYYNISVTGLYQLELNPQIQAAQHLATVRLRYHSVADGREHTITRTVRGKDLARDWSRASRRHRLASLGAVWSESLKDSAPQVDVAKRAQELSSQQPQDSRARELAHAASATATGGER